MNWKITRKGVLKGCDFDQDVTELIIPDGVKAIGEGAFQFCVNLKSVIIPEGVISIEEQAFYECRSLHRLIIPETVTNIGMDAFKNTAWMNNYPDDFVIVNHILIGHQMSFKDVPEVLHIPEGVYAINKGVPVFIYPDKKRSHFISPVIKKIILPEGLKEIGEKAFSGYEHLEEVHLPETIEKIGFDAFEKCRKLKRVPLLAHERKVFYRFPEFYVGQHRAEYIVQNHDYEIALIPEVKYDLIFQMFALNIDPEGTGNYIQKHFTEMIPVLVRLNDFALIEKFPALVQKYIDDLIQEAIEQKNYELQLTLTDYKYQHDLFSNQDWSLS